MRFLRHTASAVIGATDRPGSVVRAVLWSLVSSPFGGTVYPVSDKRTSVLAIKAYKSVAELPEPVDLAVVITPAATVPTIIGDCVATGVRGAIVISAGFKEHGEKRQGTRAPDSRAHSRDGLRLIGAELPGRHEPDQRFERDFCVHHCAPGQRRIHQPKPARCGTAILDWAKKEMVGFSSFVSVGSMLDIDWGDLIDYLGNDPRTQSIIMYMESVGDARSFLSAAREVSLTKPIIVIKAGRTEAAGPCCGFAHRVAHGQ